MWSSCSGAPCLAKDSHRPGRHTCSFLEQGSWDQAQDGFLQVGLMLLLRPWGHTTLWSFFWK